MPVLSSPLEMYKHSYLQGLLEFQAEGHNLYYDYEEIQNNFERFAQEQRDREHPTRFKMVPESVFWLIDHEEFIGRLSLRHALTDDLLKRGGHIGYEIRPSKRACGYGKEILRLGLQKAREIRFTHVLLTCDPTNWASRKIIEANGGQYIDEIYVQSYQGFVRRYWIALPK